MEEYAELLEHLDSLRVLLDVEIGLNGSRTERAFNLRVAIIETENELEQQ